MTLRSILSRYIFFYYYSRNAEREMFQKRLPISKGLILDAGCGDMWFLNTLRIKRAVGIDINLSELRKAKHNYPKYSTVLGDLRRMPFKDGAFQTIISNSVFEHIPEPIIAVKEVSRVSKKGCSIYFTIVSSEETFISQIVERAIFKNTNFLSREEWVAMFTSSGFKVRESSFYFHKIAHDVYVLFCLCPILLFTFPFVKLLKRLTPNVALYLECEKQ